MGPKKRGSLPPARADSLSLSSPFYSPPSTLRGGNNATQADGVEAPDRTGNMMTHQSHAEQKSPSPVGHVSRSSRVSQTFFCGLAALSGARPPRATAIKLPSAAAAAAATRGPFHCPSELIPPPLLMDVCPFVTRADRVSLLTPLRFSAATGTEVPLFSAEMCWKRDRGLFPKPWPPCTPTR